MTKNEKITIFRKRLKTKIVEAMGGKCQCCNYDKCNAALELHHVDPTQKDIPFGRIYANHHAWNTVVEELRKCILVCANCHREIHNDNRTLPQTYHEFDERFSSYDFIREYNNSICKVCSKKLLDMQEVTCSKTCAAKLTGSIEWKNYDLEQLYISEDKSISDISEIINCSPSAVTKRLEKLNIKKSPIKKVRPTSQELEKLLWELPMTQIGKLYGVSDVSVKKWAKKFNLKRPPTNYWQSITNTKEWHHRDDSNIHTPVKENTRN